MPVYTIRNNQTEEVNEIVMSIADKEQYLIENPHLEQIFTKFPGYVDPVSVGVIKHDNGFNDVLKKVEKAHPLGNVRSR